MGMKFGLFIGLGIGYVLGARAGREQYERIRTATHRLRQAPLVARPLDAAGQKVSDIVRAQGEAVTDKVADAVKERLFGATHSHTTANPTGPVDPTNTTSTASPSTSPGAHASPTTTHK